MNKHHESEGNMQLNIPGLTPAMSNRDDTKNGVTWLTNLPAALKLANLIPHARETRSLPPQRCWLPLADRITQILRGRWGAFNLPAASIPTPCLAPA